MGGDEFVIITPDASHPSFYHRVAEKLLRSINEEIDLDHSHVAVSCSIGIACFPEDATTYDELLKCADLAMFAAKDSGRNRYSFFNVAMANKTQQRVFIEKELKQVILDLKSIGNDMQRIEATLDQLKAPYTPGRTPFMK